MFFPLHDAAALLYRLVGPRWLAVIAATLLAALVFTVHASIQRDDARDAARQALITRAMEHGGCRLVSVQRGFTPAQFLCADGITYTGVDAVLMNFRR